MACGHCTSKASPAESGRSSRGELGREGPPIKLAFELVGGMFRENYPAADTCQQDRPGDRACDQLFLCGWSVPGGQDRERRPIADSRPSDANPILGNDDETPLQPVEVVIDDKTFHDVQHRIGLLIIETEHDHPWMRPGWDRHGGHRIRDRT